MDTHNTTPIPVFKAGSEPDSSGNARPFTAADIARIAAIYNPLIHECPFVIGHPDGTAPAWGWAARFVVDGDLLSVVPDRIDPDFAQLVNDGYYKKRSLSLYPPEHPSNPVPGHWYPRHIAWLGAVPPAKKGLPDYEFSDSDQNGTLVIVDYEESSMPTTTKETPASYTANFAEREAKLAQAEAALAEKQRQVEQQQKQQQQREIASYTEKLVSDGKLLPRESALVNQLLTVADSENTFDYAETQANLLHQFLDGLEPRVDYNERAADHSDKTPTKSPAIPESDTEKAMARMYGVKA